MKSFTYRKLFGGVKVKCDLLPWFCCTTCTWWFCSGKIQNSQILLGLFHHHYHQQWLRKQARPLLVISLLGIWWSLCNLKFCLLPVKTCITWKIFVIWIDADQRNTYPSFAHRNTWKCDVVQACTYRAYITCQQYLHVKRHFVNKRTALWI